jgi:diguanylate cyclase (GGDEF)-like protein
MKKSLTLAELKEIEDKMFKIKLLVPAFGIALYLLSAIFKSFTFPLRPLIILSASVIYLLFVLLTHYFLKKVTKENAMFNFLFVVAIAEAILVTIMVYYTGGVLSPFFVFYLFITLSVSTYRKTTYPFIIALISFAMYAALVFGEFYGLFTYFPQGLSQGSLVSIYEKTVDVGFFLLLVSFFSNAIINNFNKEHFTIDSLREATLELTAYIGDKEKIFKHVVRIAREVVGGDAASIIEYKDNNWKFLVWDNITDETIKSAEKEFRLNEPKNLEETVEKKTAILIKDTYKATYWAKSVSTRSYIGAPIIVNGIVIAVLNVDSAKPNKFTETDVSNIEILSRIISTVFEKDALLNKVRDSNRALAEISREDALTSLYNRRKLEEVLNYEINKYFRERNNFQVIFLDLDNFKLINDNSGHIEGDRILQETADLILKSARKIDYVFRYGGDEFLILIPDSPPPTVELVMNRLNLAFKEKFSSSIEQFKFGFSYGDLSFKDFYQEFINKNPGQQNNVDIISTEVLKNVDELLYSFKNLKKAL